MSDPKAPARTPFWFGSAAGAVVDQLRPALDGQRLCLSDRLLDRLDRVTVVRRGRDVPAELELRPVIGDAADPPGAALAGLELAEVERPDRAASQREIDCSLAFPRRAASTIVISPPMTESTSRSLSPTEKTGGRDTASSLHEEPDTTALPDFVTRDITSARRRQLP